MEVGDYTYGQNYIKLFQFGENTKLIIGKFCSISSDIKVFLGGNHHTDWVTTYPFGHFNQRLFNTFNGQGHPKTNGNVIIGNDVWIGHGVTIMSGVHIGDGAVIAANSHVVKNVEPYSIVGGNPARLIKYRFDKDTIDKLLNIQWWHWDIEKINNHLSLMCSSNINEFIKNVNL
jgi:acetyltransferase-like isoleucine patch superfamily enzyme